MKALNCLERENSHGACYHNVIGHQLCCQLLWLLLLV